MASLYELTQEMMALDQLLAEAGGDISEGAKGEALQKWMEEYDWKVRDKIDAYGAVIFNIKSDVESLKIESVRLNERAKVLINRIERMKSLVQFAMNTMGTRKLEGQKFTFTIAKNGGVAPIELLVDPDKLPHRFCRVVPETRVPDLDMIRTALEKGDPEAPKFAFLKERGESVRIK